MAPTPPVQRVRGRLFAILWDADAQAFLPVPLPQMPAAELQPAPPSSGEPPCDPS